MRSSESKKISEHFVLWSEPWSLDDENNACADINSLLNDAIKNNTEEKDKIINIQRVVQDDLCMFWIYIERQCEQKEIPTENSFVCRTCIKCGKSKHDEDFIKWRVGVKSQGEIFSTGNICLDCKDIESANRYLLKQLDKFEAECNVRLKNKKIPEELISLKAIMLKLNRKINKL